MPKPPCLVAFDKIHRWSLYCHEHDYDWLQVFLPFREPASSAQPAAATPATDKIGGSDVIKLQRKATGDGSKPEFLTATILPGRGMNLYQITASVPGKGEIPIFFDLPDQFTTGADDSIGNRSFAGGGAFLAPYPNRILGKLSPDGKTLTTEWRGKTLTLPANWAGKKPGAPPHAIHGLILKTQAEELSTETTADGQTQTGVIHAGDFGGHWPSKTDLTFAIALTAARWTCRSRPRMSATRTSRWALAGILTLRSRAATANRRGCMFPAKSWRW